MYYTLSRLYKAGKITDDELTNAVTKEWITDEEKAEIITN